MLSGIDTILFDIDGVMLSEERYFDASALTVWEILTSPQYLGIRVSSLPEFRVKLDNTEISKIRKLVFADDSVLQSMKQRGVNANWDMVYLQVSQQLCYLLQYWVSVVGQSTVVDALKKFTVSGGSNVSDNGWTEACLQQVNQQITELGMHAGDAISFGAYNESNASCVTKADLFGQVNLSLARTLGDGAVDVAGTVPNFESNRALWMTCQRAFQAWYLGDKYLSVLETGKVTGKLGFLHDEVPIIDVTKFGMFLKRCQDNGFSIGIATGRPQIETYVPLQELGWLDRFDEDRISTASDVLEAERQQPDRAPLSKPHPYSYVRSYLGAAAQPEQVLACRLPLARDAACKVLVVGDSVADALAAQAMGCEFVAVLSGLDGESARHQFEQLPHRLILPNVLSLEKHLFT